MEIISCRVDGKEALWDAGGGAGAGGHFPLLYCDGGASAEGKKERKKVRKKGGVGVSVVQDLVLVRCYMVLVLGLASGGLWCFVLRIV